MTLRNKKRRAKAKPPKASFAQEETRVGLLVTSELEKARMDCKAQVERIARDCRAQNRCFRDVEFDLENDRELCLFGLSRKNSEIGTGPSDVQRATKIFSSPSLFIDGASANDIVQGRLGDCWFLSALSTMTTAKGLIEKFCVARDEQVGVYGWIFFRDSSWVTVIIDDLLFQAIPKFEQLTQEEQGLYHRDKDLFNMSARKGGKSLYFARSAQEGETWVSLFEKAFAKLHGDYTAISAGFSCEAIEDLTGGVSTFIPTKDILDPDLFWKQELLLATKDRLFGCGFDTLDSSRNQKEGVTVNGLIGSHAYSVLRAVEFNGKRFVVLRNPWGDSEWTGPWSDGSKEWTEEWLPALRVLQHQFGDDGEFVMEYSDFLDNWDLVERTLLFDDTWVMANQWLQVTARPPSGAWSYGDVSFTIFVPASTKAVIVLSKLDERYFQDISGNSCWTFDFTLFKKGEKELVAQSSLTRFYLRSVNVEVQLEAGDYVVHVRLDRQLNTTDFTEYHPGNCDTRKFSRVKTQRAKSQSIASNFTPGVALDNVPIPLEILAGQDLPALETKANAAEKKLKAAEALRKPERKKTSWGGKEPERKESKKEEETTIAVASDTMPELETKANAAEKKSKAAEALRKPERKKTSWGGKEPERKEFKKEEEATITVASDTTIFRKRKNTHHAKPSVGVSPRDVAYIHGDQENWTEEEGGGYEVDLDNIPSSLASEDLGLRSRVGSPLPLLPAPVDAPSEDDSEDEYGQVNSAAGSGYDNDTVVLGLRVYTSKHAPAVLGGQLRHEIKASFPALESAAL